MEILYKLRERVETLDRQFEKLDIKLSNSILETAKIFKTNCDDCTNQKISCEKKFSKTYLAMALLTAFVVGKTGLWLVEIISSFHGK